MQLKNKICSRNGINISYFSTEKSNDDPVLVINGGPGQDHKHLLFSNVWEHLSQKRKIIFYDQRGIGESTIPPEKSNFSIPELLLDIVTILEDNNLDSVHVISHSWGGLLGLSLGALYPEKVKKLVVVNGAGCKLAGDANVHNDFFPDKMEELEKLMKNNDIDVIYQDIVRHNIHLNFLDKKYVNPFLEYIGEKPLNLEVNMKTFQDNENFDISDSLGSINSEVLFIHGRYDITVKPKVAYELHNLVKGSKLEFFAKSGHLPFIEEPEKFIDVVSNFLGL